MSVNNKKLNSLKEYITSTGSTDQEDLMAQLQTEDTEVLQEYVDALKAKWPAEFDPENYVEESPQEEVFTFWLKKDDNTLQELEKFRDKNNKITFVVKEPKDEVQVMVAGKLVTLDLLKLAKDPVANARLIVAAEVAKG